MASLARRSAGVQRALVAACVLALASACHGQARVQAPAQDVVPVRVSLPSPRDVRLHRDTPDSLLSGVTALEGTLLELDRDSLRMDITRARSRGRWMDVAAPSGAVLANQPGTSVERRVISRSRTALVIGATWIAVAAVVHAGLGWP